MATSGAAADYLACDTRLDRFLLLVGCSPAKLHDLAASIRQAVETDAGPDDDTVALVIEAAARGDATDAAMSLGALNGILDDAWAAVWPDGADERTLDGLGAVLSSDQAVDADDPEVMWRLARLSLALRERASDPDALVQAHELAVDALGGLEQAEVPDPSQLAEAAWTAGVLECALWHSTREPPYLDAAVAHSRRAVDLTPAGSADTSRRLTTLSQHLAGHFHLRGDHTALEEAVASARQAVALTAEGQDLSTRVAALADALMLRFEALGQREDIDEAIDHASHAVALTTERTAAVAGHLNNLGLCLARRFPATGDPADLDDAVDCSRRAIDLAGAGADRPALLITLGSHLAARHAAGGGGEADLTEAVGVAVDAVDATPSASSERPARLSNLAAHLFARFEAGGNRRDLVEAVARGREAVLLTAFSSALRPKVAANLAGYLARRFTIDRNARDRDDAVVFAREAVARAPDDPACLMTMASALTLPSEGGLVQSDVDAAVAHSRHAVDVTPPGSPLLAKLSGHLAAQLAIRSGVTGDASDLDEAISIARGAVELLPGTHPDLSTSLNNLARFLTMRLGTDFDEADLEALEDVLGQWAEVCERGLASRFDVTVAGPLWVRQLMRLAMFGPIRLRKLVARLGAAVLSGAERLSELPDDVGPEARRAHALDLRRAVDGVAARAAYAHLLAYGNDAAGALELLENGLTTIAVEQAGGPLWQRARESEPELVERLTQITRRLRVARSQGQTVDALWAERRSALAELEGRVGRLGIRRGVEELAETAKTVGLPLMWIACTPAGGLLIVLRPEGQRFHVLLPELKSDRVSAWQARLHSTRQTFDPSAPTLRAAVDQPSSAPSAEDCTRVMDELAATLGSIETWWGDDAWVVPVGQLATLPWQARWPRLRLHTSGALHIVAHANAQRPRSALAAALFDSEFDDAGDERRGLARHVGATVLTGPEATLAELKNLGRLGVLHFAVHGTTEPALLLKDGVLRPDDLVDYPDQFSALRLLFANACFSGSIGEDALDEASGFATAAAVTGTSATLTALWPVFDPTAVAFAANFYARLHDHGDPQGALREARAGTSPDNAGDATLLAYQLYGH
jgi:tetratricopeptide (TPR) repeat protein